MEDRIREILADQKKIQDVIQQLLGQTTQLKEVVVIPLWAVEIGTEALRDTEGADQIAPVYSSSKEMSSIELRVLVGKLLRLIGEIHTSVQRQLLVSSTKIEELVDLLQENADERE